MKSETGDGRPEKGKRQKEKVERRAEGGRHQAHLVYIMIALKGQLISASGIARRNKADKGIAP